MLIILYFLPDDYTKRCSPCWVLALSYSMQSLNVHGEVKTLVSGFTHAPKIPFLRALWIMLFNNAYSLGLVWQVCSRNNCACSSWIQYVYYKEQV